MAQIIHIDAGHSVFINTYSMQFVGWIWNEDGEIGRNDVDVYINSIKQGFFTAERPDVVAAREGGSALGFSVSIDTMMYTNHFSNKFRITVLCFQKVIYESNYFLDWRLRFSGPDVPLNFFLHIPKTAGTLLREMLGRSVPPGRFMYVHDQNNGISKETFREIKIEKLSNIDFVFGHLSMSDTWRFSGYRPDAPISLSQKPLRRLQLFTFVRDPLDRVVSEYFHKIRGDVIDKNMSIVDAVRAGGIADNVITRFLSGTARFGEICSISDYMAARRNIADFSFIGVIEDFDASISFLRQYFPAMGEPLADINRAPAEQIETFWASHDRRELAEMLAPYLCYDIHLYREICANAPWKAVTLPPTPADLW